jgi:hypothetical protein
MTTRVKLAVLRILILREEFSAEQLSTAARIISEGEQKTLLALLL